VVRARASADRDLVAWSAALEAAAERLLSVTRVLLAAGDPARALANATAYLEAFGHVVVAWIWLEQALAAHDRSGDFYEGKRQACRYFFGWELPRTAPQFDLLERLDETTLQMRQAWF
jgi:hypothetical protein